MGLQMYRENSILYLRKRHQLKLYEQNPPKSMPKHPQNNLFLPQLKQMINHKCLKPLKISNKKINSTYKKSRKKEPCKKRKNNNKR